MMEFEMDEESQARAERLTSRLMHDLRMLSEERPSEEARREVFSARRFAEEAAGARVNDVVGNFGQMATEFAFARRWDNEVPCLTLAGGDLIPISMRGGFAFEVPYFSRVVDWLEFWERFGPFPMRHLLRSLHDRAYGEHVRVVSVKDALSAVERSTRDFLSYRFAGAKKWAEWIRGKQDDSSPDPRRSTSSGSPPPPSVGPGGGLQVQVSCLTPGLRLHVSPAYFVTWAFFACPTTPVTGWVLPGRYIFAGDGPMLTDFTVDDGTFCIPPSYNPALMRF